MCLRTIPWGAGMRPLPVYASATGVRFDGTVGSTPTTRRSVPWHATYHRGKLISMMLSAPTTGAVSTKSRNVVQNILYKRSVLCRFVGVK